jgi:hypothetical protein
MARARTVVGELKSEFDRELAHAEELKRLVEREVEVEAAELRKVADEANKTIPIEPSRTTPPSPSSSNPPAGSTDKSALPPRDRSDP